MCDPGTLLMASAVLQGTGSLLSAQSESENLKYQAKQHENNARLAKLSIGIEQYAGKARESRLAKQNAQILAAQIAQRAGSGIDVGDVSSQEVFESTISVGAADILQEQLNTETSIWQLENAFIAEKQAASTSKKAARRTMTLAPIGFAAPLIGAAASSSANS